MPRMKPRQSATHTLGEDNVTEHHQPLTLAALYAKESSDGQDVDLSVSAQLRALKDYAKSNGCFVTGEHVDGAVS